MNSGTNRPAVTPAQIVGALIAGIPVVSNLLAAFHVFTVSVVQQQALSNAVTWGGVTAGVLIGGDAALRAARNHADAKVSAAAVAPVSPALVNTPSGAGLQPELEPVSEDDASTLVPDSDLPSDDEELASPPPEEDLGEPTEPAVVQPTQSATADA